MYEHWYERIAGEYYPAVNACVEEMVKTGRGGAYPWYHPDLGKIYIRCGGVADRTYSRGCVLGYHQNVTDTTVMRREKEKLEELNQEIVGSLYNLFFAGTGLILRKALSAPYVSRRCAGNPTEFFP